MGQNQEQYLGFERERDVVFVFGAGASYADGAPLQADLLPYILFGNDSEISESKLGKLVTKFISSHFYVSKEIIPTLEAIFAYLDYYINTNESLGGDINTSKIIEIREALITLLHYTISKKRIFEKRIYHKFWKRVEDVGLNIGVISLNYDTLLDDSFDFLYPDKGYIDYCINLMNYDWYDKYHKEIESFNWWINPREPVYVSKGCKPKVIKIIKLHGSLNWKYCNCCNQVLLTAWDSDIDLNNSGFIKYDHVKDQSVEFRCPIDSSKFRTLIVPPSHFKDLTHPIINLLRDEAAREIRCAKKLVFVGYSFPEADAHIKALFHKNKNPNCDLIVINRTITEQIKASYLSLDNKAVFKKSTFDDALEDGELFHELFSCYKKDEL